MQISMFSRYAGDGVDVFFPQIFQRFHRKIAGFQINRGYLQSIFHCIPLQITLCIINLMCREKLIQCFGIDVVAQCCSVDVLHLQSCCQTSDQTTRIPHVIDGISQSILFPSRVTLCVIGNIFQNGWRWCLHACLFLMKIPQTHQNKKQEQTQHRSAKHGCFAAVSMSFHSGLPF